MEKVVADEQAVNARLAALEERRRALGSRLIDLRSIKAPGDLALIHAHLHQTALERNAALLQEVDLATGKLHTRTLLPMHHKVLALRKAYIDKRP